MISSMTGFGRAKANTAIGLVSIEMRCVNFRYLESQVRVPNALSFLEMPVRERLKERFKRGKMDLFLKWEPRPDYEPTVEFNVPLIERMMKQYESLRKKIKQAPPLDPASLLGLPQVVVATSREMNEEEVWKHVGPVVEKAIDAMEKNRRREGKALKKALKEYLDALDKGRATIEKEQAQIVSDFRDRLRTRVAELMDRSPEQLDQGRLEMEIAIMAEKSDVAEELVRLASHVSMFNQLLGQEDGEPIGRQLDFLCVELQREVNTLGAKCRTAGLLPVSLEMKNLVEKLREQVQNIE